MKSSQSDIDTFTWLLALQQVPTLVLCMVKLLMIIIEAAWPKMGVLDIEETETGYQHLWEIGPDLIKMLLVLVNFNIKYFTAAFWHEVSNFIYEEFGDEYMTGDLAFLEEVFNPNDRNGKKDGKKKHHKDGKHDD